MLFLFHRIGLFNLWLFKYNIMNIIFKRLYRLVVWVVTFNESLRLLLLSLSFGTIRIRGIGRCWRSRQLPRVSRFRGRSSWRDDGRRGFGKEIRRRRRKLAHRREVNRRFVVYHHLIERYLVSCNRLDKLIVDKTIIKWRVVKQKQKFTVTWRWR